MFIVKHAIHDSCKYAQIPVIGLAMSLAKHVFLKRDGDLRSTIETTEACKQRVSDYDSSRHRDLHHSSIHSPAEGQQLCRLVCGGNTQRRWKVAEVSCLFTS
jgi:hypothetical protein